MATQNQILVLQHRENSSNINSISTEKSNRTLENLRYSDCEANKKSNSKKHSADSR